MARLTLSLSFCFQDPRRTAILTAEVLSCIISVSTYLREYLRRFPRMQQMSLRNLHNSQFICRCVISSATIRRDNRAVRCKRN